MRQDMETLLGTTWRPCWVYGSFFYRFEPCNHLPIFCLIDYHWLLLFLFSIRCPDLTDNILLIYQIEIKTTPADFCFPTTNHTRHYFTRYVEFHRCVSAKGDEAAKCEKFAKYYRSLCPAEWVDKWNEQRENETFIGPL
ncbi:cytochrome c oxidase subunit 6b-3-like [Hordeum vulgare subsp. vulgare]|uniref:cytochrome c oxidase subunit 6b-3-like n=1 Tax=Hordeum vulgare subsp. vulgare TaxID=112509 RepID=UPI001D1A3622|nr:cytochrome c oxidase subunit 6b-3-like [Hordeum vulgare subsp. vulgare]